MQSDPWVDDPNQPDVRSRVGRDCTAAECFEPNEVRAEPINVDPPEIALPRPFVWQCGRKLLLLDWELTSWALAELEFEPEICRYRELRRAFYRWEREAVGALLSRTLAYGEDAALESSELLDVWLRHRR